MPEPTNPPALCCTLDIGGAEQERLVNMLKALGNPTRFEIMKYLLTHPGCITGDIVAVLPLAPSSRPTSRLLGRALHVYAGANSFPKLPRHGSTTSSVTAS